MANQTDRQSNNIFPEMEKQVLDFWKKAKTFEKSVEKQAPNRSYVFYDGPPFATGLPHYGHIVANVMKDVVPRYYTMRGYRVERRWGWDCHGLPIENLAEKELGLKNKKDIEKIGIEKFNTHCRSIVMRYADEWKKIIKRIGRWVDMENDYKTMDMDYMESIWRVFKQLWDKGFIYEGYKAMHICPRCGTTLSNFEVTLNYKDIKDISATAKFKLKYPVGKTGRGVGALVYNDKNEVLLLRRNENGRRKTWAMPGGKVDKGETFKEALKREVMEELGVEIVSAEPFVAKPDIFEGRLFETVCFKVKIKGEPAVMEKNKVDKLEWFSFDDLPEVNYPPSRDALEIYKQNKELFYFDIDMSKSLSAVYILAWTTTPWTLPGNVALVAGDSIKYQIVSIKGKEDFYVLAKDRVSEIFKDKEFKILNEIHGNELVGLEYEPLFDYYFEKQDLKNKENGWKIYNADFVNTEEGTGIVHIAPAFGEDDMELGKKYKLPFVQHIDFNGKIKNEIKDFAGLEVKPENDLQETDRKIIDYLKSANKLFSEQEYEHSYPHCWRCDTCLLNYATDSWFVKVADIKDNLIKNNENINWIPEHIKYGRFGKWLEQARDWAISRNRYWGSSLPVWKCSDKECGNIKVVGSVEELEKLSSQKIQDLHRPDIDEIKFKCEKCGKIMTRIPEVFDCWFESGAMPYAQEHYPFENKEKFEKNFPADFIAEGVDQTRGWFYVLHILATALEIKGKTSSAFKNVIVNGMVLAEDGKKMSKRLNNYPDPAELFEKYSVDALRYYLLCSPVFIAENLNFSEDGVKEALKKIEMILWNVYKFYAMYANENLELINKECAEEGKEQNLEFENSNVLDKWIICRLNQLIKETTENMEKYNLPKAARPVEGFINDLSTWYLRCSRARFKSENKEEKKTAIKTMRFALLELSKIMAVFMPFISEQIWQKITQNNFQDINKSVHLEKWPVSGDVDADILRKMELVRKIVEMGLSERDKNKISLAQPLNKLKIKLKNKEILIDDEYIELIKNEINIKQAEICFDSSIQDIEVELDIELTAELKQEGIKRKIIRLINATRKQAKMTIQDRAVVYFETDDKDIKEVIQKYKKDILKAVLADDIIEGIDNNFDFEKQSQINEKKICLAISKK
ncbi:MAG: isoleucine--tRNA ligase [Patescibacteria group bacterium]|nr:isoleucine--tRNA ligase [Patescibacteria group bacterium]